MANVEYVDAAFVLDSSIPGGQAIGFSATGVPFGSAIAVTAWGVSVTGAIVQVQNQRITSAQEVLFDVANIGDGESLVDGLNIALSIVTS
jgi:hypothetical protein